MNSRKKARLNRLSEISTGISEISIISIVILSAFDKFNEIMIVLGVVIMNFNVDNLIYFYLILALLAVAIAIVAYGTMKYDSKPRSKK
jgi:hypothetical protein